MQEGSRLKRLMRPIALGLVGVAALVSVAYVTVRLAPHVLADTRGLGPKDAREEQGRVRTALLALLAGSVAVLGAIYTARSFQLSREGHALDVERQITERFTRAVDQLGSEQLDVRLGGIYGLERIARDSASDRRPIMEILTAYVRHHAPLPMRSARRRRRMRGWKPELVDYFRDGPAADVQAVMTVLGRVNAMHGASREPMHAASRELNLGWVGLTGADLWGAHLEDAFLRGAHLERAIFIKANLEDAILSEAHLEDAIFQQAHLGGAKLIRAHLEGAYFSGADLRDTRLDGASLIGAHLEDANLRTAHIDDETDLESATCSDQTQWPEQWEPGEAERRGVLVEGSGES